MSRANSRRRRVIGLLIAMIVVYPLIALLALGPNPGLGPGTVSEHIRDLFWFCLFCGVASFATIEIGKRLTDVRSRAQTRQLCGWLEERLSDQAVAIEMRSADAFTELRDAMGLKKGPQRVFGLPTEQLVGQISAAADFALASPRQHPVLLFALVGRPPMSSRSGGSVDEQATYEDAQRVRVAVDQLQIVLGEDWRRRVQTAAVVLAGAYAWGFVWLVGVPRSAVVFYVVAALLVGGLFAWIIRDVVAVIERLRRY